MFVPFMCGWRFDDSRLLYRLWSDAASVMFSARERDKCDRRAVTVRSLRSGVFNGLLSARIRRNGLGQRVPLGGRNSVCSKLGAACRLTPA